MGWSKSSRASAKTDDTRKPNSAEIQIHVFLISNCPVLRNQKTASQLPPGARSVAVWAATGRPGYEISVTRHNPAAWWLTPWITTGSRIIILQCWAADWSNDRGWRDRREGGGGGGGGGGVSVGEIRRGGGSRARQRHGPDFSLAGGRRSTSLAPGPTHGVWVCIEGKAKQINLEAGGREEEELFLISRLRKT